MLGDALQAFPGQVQPVEIGVMAFQPGHDPQGLGIVVEAAIGRHQPFHRILAGVAEGGVAKVVGQRHRFRQVGVQPQHPGDGAGDLCHLDGMGQAGAVIVALMFHKHLRLVLQAAKRFTMNNSISISLKSGANRTLLFRTLPSRFLAITCMRRQYLLF